MFRANLVLGLILVGLGIAELVQGELVLGLFQVAFSIALCVMAVLRRKGILPEGLPRPAPPNPYQENLPG